MSASLVGSEMCIRDRAWPAAWLQAAAWPVAWPAAWLQAAAWPVAWPVAWLQAAEWPVAWPSESCGELPESSGGPQESLWRVSGKLAESHRL
eukprot:1359269-Alexandrium_andersonii.AAC.1